MSKNWKIIFSVTEEMVTTVVAAVTDLRNGIRPPQVIPPDDLAQPREPQVRQLPDLRRYKSVAAPPANGHAHRYKNGQRLKRYPGKVLIYKTLTEHDGEVPIVLMEAEFAKYEFADHSLSATMSKERQSGMVLQTSRDTFKLNPDKDLAKLREWLANEISRADRMAEGH